MPSPRAEGPTAYVLRPSDLSPAGVDPLLLRPPIVYLWIALIAFCGWLSFIRTTLVWDRLVPYSYPVLDFIAMIARGIFAIAEGICWMSRRCFYPLKEGVFCLVDRIDHCWHPSKRRRPHTHVPFFEF
eukprot:TRINITY_DN55026_c0_g1_i1.p1 TRINITY_DN55026_c0_g1~~TRINITY_DN55026_c0_g1_i1.p1  ORF type:complete len:128 (+),score=4.36 TRINITY_DN55026_c0_g1_i1:203-586(+)